MRETASGMVAENNQTCTSALQVHQATGSGHHDVYALLEGFDLGRNVGSAVYRQQAHGRQVGGVLFQFNRNLDAKFPRGRQDQGLGPSGGTTKIFQQRKSEGGGFSGSGLRKGDQVDHALNRQKLFHHPRLNLCGRRKSQVGNRLEQLRPKPKRIKL
jgi:hypothetical protein